MRRGHICLEGYWRIDIILKESPGIKTGEWLPEKQPLPISFRSLPHATGIYPGCSF
jgi:hypothetical protein